MVAKQKKISEEKKTPPRAPMVTQVVEVVEEEITSPKVKDEEISAEALVTAERELPQEIPAESGAALEDHLNLEKKETEPTVEAQKETVAELFKKSQTPVMPEISMHTQGASKKNLLLWALVIIILAGLAGGGLMIAKKKSFSLGSFSPAPSPTPTPTPTPIPTPAPLNKGDMTIQIINGGGVAGAASKMKKLLEDKGYKIGDVSNADSYTYTKTEVHVKAAKSAYQKLLIDDLKDTYSIATDTSSLTDSASFDARIIVGTQ